MDFDSEEEKPFTRMQNFVKYFVNNFQNVLTFYNIILKGKTKSYLAVLLNIAECVSLVQEDLKDALRNIMEAGNLVNLYIEDGHIKKNAVTLSKIVYAFEEDPLKTTSLLIKAAVDIFQSYEIQLTEYLVVHQVDNRKAAEIFANLCVKKILEFCIEKRQNELTLKCIEQALKNENTSNVFQSNETCMIFETTNTPEIYIKNNNNSRKLERITLNEDLFSKCGILIGNRSGTYTYYKTKNSDTATYGYRRLYYNETETNLHGVSKENNNKSSITNYKFSFKRDELDYLVEIIITAYLTNQDFEEIADKLIDGVKNTNNLAFDIVHKVTIPKIKLKNLDVMTKIVSLQRQLRNIVDEDLQTIDINMMVSRFVSYFVNIFANQVKFYSLVLLDDRCMPEMINELFSASVDFVNESIPEIVSSYSSISNIMNNVSTKIKYLFSCGNKKQARQLSGFIRNFIADTDAAARLLVVAGVRIFYCYEMQFVETFRKCNSNFLCLRNFAAAAVVQVLNYYLHNDDSFNAETITIAIRTRNETNLCVRLPFEVDWSWKLLEHGNNTNIKEMFYKTGIVMLSNEHYSYHKTDYSETKTYGYRRLFVSEVSYLSKLNEEDNACKEDYDYCISNDHIKDLTDSNMKQLPSNVMSKIVCDEIKNCTHQKLKNLPEVIITAALSNITIDTIIELIPYNYNKIENTEFDILDNLEDIKNIIANKIAKKEKTVPWYNMKYPVGNFVGRHEYLKEIHDQYKFVVIFNFGGLGKSELCRKYSYDHRQDFKNIVWITADTDEDMRECFFGLAAELDIPVQNPRLLSSIVQEIFKEIENKSSLIIYDNAENLISVKDYLPENIKNNVKVLITSRDSEWDENFHVIHLPVLEDNEATNLMDITLNTYIDVQEQEGNIKKVTELLGNLPLALQQSMAFIIDEAQSGNIEKAVEEYVENYKKLIAEAEHRSTHFDFFTNEYHRTIFSTVLMSFQKLLRTDVDNGRITLIILKFFAYASPENVNKKLLDSIFSKISIKHGIEALIKYSLVDIQKNKINVHSLIYEIARIEAINDGSIFFALQCALGYMILHDYVKSSDDIYYERNPHSIFILGYAERNIEIFMAFYLKQSRARKNQLTLLACYYGCIEIIKTIYDSEKQNKLHEHTYQSFENDPVVLPELCNNNSDRLITITYDNDLYSKRYDGLVAHLACLEEKYKLVEYLTSINIDINQRNEKNQTVLHLATINDKINTVEWLISKRIYQNLTDDDKYFLLDIAAGKKNKRILNLFIAKRFLDNITIIDASKRGHHQIVELLLENGISVDVKDKNGYTPILAAAYGGHKGIIELLLKNGANIESMDNQGTTAIGIAAINGYTEIVQLLLKNNANAEIKNKDGNTPLALAFSNNKTETVNCLLSKGVEKEIKSTKSTKFTERKINYLLKIADPKIRSKEIENVKTLI